jgi:hypothetical protein
MKLWLLSVLAAAVVSGEAAAGSTNVSRPDLTGQVLTADASPLADATVFIDTAGPKVGRGTL